MSENTAVPPSSVTDTRRLTVAAAQPKTVLNDSDTNALAHADAIRRSRARLVVFPEMSLTGYSMDAPVVHSNDPAFDVIAEACRDTHTVALVGAAVRCESRRAIGVIAVDGSGAQVAYRRMSLGGAEVDAYVAGCTPGVVTVDGWRVGLGVCKDTRISEHLDATADAGIDIYAAGLLHRPEELSAFDDRAVAIVERFGVAVVFAGFAGATGGGFPVTSGGSAIWNRRGQCLQRAGDQTGDYAAAELRL
ncbi:carbon-nitrogen hydrolase family protein [Rhodococcus sp. NPDC078407]|uniref:carbon-nitrogen hydrolase family protein n=1 Tax=Rhodococcus sp. NPDC078407 TaxID=3364509 RepID=UPI0037CB4DA8